MRKHCGVLCKHAKHAGSTKPWSGEAEMFHAKTGNASGTTLLMASGGVGLLASTASLTLNASSGRCCHSVHPPDYQRRCFSTNARSKTYYYDVLGVSPKATHGEIKSAYYKLSKLYHPDINKDVSNVKFSQISESYEILGNTKKRRMYDQGIYSRNEPPVDDSDSDYTQAFREREGFGFERQAPPTGRTNQYNFDEFYRQHYGDTMRQRQEHIEYLRMMEQEAAREKVEKKLRLVVTGSMIASLFIVFVYSNFWPGNRPGTSRPNGKKT